MNRKRKQYFIDRTFQTKFIIKFCVIVIISSLLVGGLLFFLSRGSTTVAIENTKIIVKKTSDFIAPLLKGTLFLATVFSAFFVLILTLFTSHRIAGPLYRLKKEIDALKGYDLTRNFNVRSKDQLKSLARSLDEMSKSLRAKQLELKEKCACLKKYLKGRELTNSAREKEEIAKMLDEIEAILHYFKM